MVRIATSADYIVIGAGSAGAAIGGRLSEDGACSVLMLEAGGPDSNRDIHIPARFSELFHSAEDWDYQTIPQPGLNNRRDYVPRGKVFGGTSSMNAMVYQRGHPSDYDGWAALGNPGWAYAEICPFFVRCSIRNGANRRITALADRSTSLTRKTRTP